MKPVAVLRDKHTDFWVVQLNLNGPGYVFIVIPNEEYIDELAVYQADTSTRYQSRIIECMLDVAARWGVNLSPWLEE